jgi:membrane protein DedA with SNARE-associated domain
MTAWLEWLATWTTDLVHTLGYPGVALAVAAENVFPPIPSEVVLPLAGFLAGQGRFSFILAVLAATIGSVLGALVLYGAGRWLGEAKTRWFVRRYGRWFLVTERDFDASLDWFSRHGRKSVCLGRVVPLVRSLVSIPAGVAGIPLIPFMLYTAAGSTVWNTALIGVGWILGDQWSHVEDYIRPLSYAVLLLAGFAAAWFVWRRGLARRAGTEQSRE